MYKRDETGLYPLKTRGMVPGLGFMISAMRPGKVLAEFIRPSLFRRWTGMYQRAGGLGVLGVVAAAVRDGFGGARLVDRRTDAGSYGRWLVRQ